MVCNFVVCSCCKGLGVVSLVLWFFVLCSFFDWLVSQNEFKVNLVKGVLVLKVLCYLLKNIDVDDMNWLLDIDINDFFVVCDCVMLEVMYGVGLCFFELVGLDIKYFDLEFGEVWVMGKGSKECCLLIGCNVVVWIEYWFDLCDLFGSEDDVFFLLKLGKCIFVCNVQKCFVEWGIK